MNSKTRTWSEEAMFTLGSKNIERTPKAERVQYSKEILEILTKLKGKDKMLVIT